MVSQKWKNNWSKFKFRLRDITHVISGVGLGFGLLFLILGALSLWFPEVLPADFYFAFAQESGRLDLCTAGAGLLLTIFAGYYFADNLNNRRKFNKLYNTNRKEKFIKNREKLEELAYFISTRHERMVQKKVKELKLR